jgi:quinohemoprotein ethanol dehydrogenase
VRRILTLGLCTLLIIVISTEDHASPPTGAANVTAKRLLNAAREPSQWMTYGGNYEEHRYSRLKQINRDNVKQLGLAWYADHDTNLQQNATPLYIDGVLYVSTAWSNVEAFDARTGKLLWTYRAKVPGEWTVNVCCGLANRGIAAYNGKIYVGTLDGRLVAIDAKTGNEVWSTLTIDKTQRYSITSAPRVARGKVFIGNSGSEFGVRGYIGAYDAETGKPLWRFYTVPAHPEGPFENEAMRKAAATWGKGDWWKLGGGGTVWDAIVYDPKTELLFFGTGNGTPWNMDMRDPEGGDNLYLASIIAVKPDTGEYVWHYQTTPADTWDYDAASPMTLADLTVDGKKRRVLMQPSKNGFFYMLEAATGKLLRAVPFTEVNWADGVDMQTGRPRVRPESRYRERPFNLAPGVQGAHGWHANAFDPESGLLYIPTQYAWFAMIPDPKYKRSSTGFNLGIDMAGQFAYYRDNPNEKRDFKGYLQAWDPVAGKTVWEGDRNDGPTGGALVTAGGLVFQGSGGGQEFRAYDARTGEKLWSTNARTAVLAPPISYEVDGKQYIAVSVGGNQRGGYYAPNYARLLAFTLGGNLELPPAEPFTPLPLDPPPATATTEVVQLGRQKYSQFCAACHGENGTVRGAIFPDLTRTPLLHSQEGFDQVVLEGVRSERGMVSFATSLKPEDSAAIRAFIIHRANELKNAQAAQPGGSGPRPPSQQHEDPSASR